MNEQWAAYQGIQGRLPAAWATLTARARTCWRCKGALRKLVERFEARFGAQRAGCFLRAGGARNWRQHTDHNNGRVLAAAVDLDTIACVSATEDHTIAWTARASRRSR